MANKKGCKRNPDGALDALRQMWAEMFTLDFAKESGIVGISSVLTPVTAGALRGLGNLIKDDLVPNNWWVQKGLDLMATVINSSIATMVFRSSEVTRLWMLGGVGGTFSDVATEQGLPLLGLGAFVTARDIEQAQLSGAATVDDLPPELTEGGGVGDFATVEDVADAETMGAFATITDVEQAEDAGVGDFATVEDLEDAGGSGVGAFLTTDSINEDMGADGF